MPRTIPCFDGNPTETIKHRQETVSPLPHKNQKRYRNPSDILVLKKSLDDAEELRWVR